MSKFDPGDFVKVGKGNSATFGRVVGRRGRSYRIFTVSREQRVADGRLLSRQKRAVLILESNLSSGREGLRTDQQRRAGVFLEEFFRSMDLTVLREKVHSPNDLKHFMNIARHKDVLFVHWSGHGFDGDYERGRNRLTGVQFTHGDFMYLPNDSEDDLLIAKETGRYRRSRVTKAIARGIDEDLASYALIRDTFANLSDKVLVFSACNIGKQHGLAQHISRISGAKAVITYDDVITDQAANLAEAVLYFKLVWHETKRSTPAKIVSSVLSSLTTEDSAAIPLVCFVDGRRVGES